MTQLSCRSEKDKKEVDLKPFRPVPAKNHPTLIARPIELDMTDVQIAFWDYLEPFNSLPGNATKTARDIFRTKGEAPNFNYLSTSKVSLFGDFEGVMDHRETFISRYPWVKQQLEKYRVTLEVDREKFAGSKKEILEKYYVFTEYNMEFKNRSVFVKQWLECLLIVDFIYAKGSQDDRKHGLSLMHYVFSVPASRSVVGMAELGHELEAPATCEIAMALMNDFPSEISELTVVLPISILQKSNVPALWTNYNKWVLRVEAFKKWPNECRLCRVYVNNSCVKNLLLTYAIYWHHCHNTVRPQKGWADTAVRQLYKRIYGKNFKDEYQNYLKLLNAAYPPNN